MCLSMRDHVHAYMSVSAHAREKARATAREYAGFFFFLVELQVGQCGSSYIKGHMRQQESMLDFNFPR